MSLWCVMGQWQTTQRIIWTYRPFFATSLRGQSVSPGHCDPTEWQNSSHRGAYLLRSHVADWKYSPWCSSGIVEVCPTFWEPPHHAIERYIYVGLLYKTHSIVLCPMKYKLKLDFGEFYLFLSASFRVFKSLHPYWFRLRVGALKQPEKLKIY